MPSESPENLEEERKKKKSLEFTGSSGPLLFRGAQQPDPLIFRGRSSPFSKSVWEMIRTGEILQDHHLPVYLQGEDTRGLQIKPEDENACSMVDNGRSTVTISRNQDDSLGFMADSSKSGKINSIRLMMATAQCAARLEYERRLKEWLGENQAGEYQEKAETGVLEANPDLFRFTITTCASVGDVVLMLKEIQASSPPSLEARLSKSVAKQVTDALANLRDPFSPEHRKILQDQLKKEGLLPASAPDPSPMLPQAQAPSTSRALPQRPPLPPKRN